jgi:LysR family transcriptional activator of nhaA
MKWLNYHHLLYFKVIATEGGIAKAAKKLRLGQPTLSTQLKQLEDALSQQLFERNHKNLVLTEAGKVTLDYANEIFGLGDELLNVLQDESFSIKIRVNVGVLDSVPKVCVVRLAETAMSFGNCSMSLLEGKSDELFRELFAHRLDLVLTNHTPHFSGNKAEAAFTKPIAKFPVGVFSSPKYKALAKNFPQSLMGQPFILPTMHSKLRHDLDHYFRTNGIVVECLVETQDTAVQKLLCIDEMGLIAIPEFVGNILVAEGKLIKLGLLESVFEEIWLIAGARRIENPIASKIMKSFKFSQEK